MKTLREYIEIVESLTEAWTPSPEQAKWLGGANQQDPYILNRMPGAKPPISHFTDPADQALAKRMGFPADAPAPAPVAEPVAVATPVAEPTNVEPTPLPPTTPAKPPAQQGARPAGDPKVKTLQNKLIGLGAKITADGIMGPATQAAMKQYGLDANGNPVKDPKTGQPVTNATTANAIIQRGGIKSGEITPDMTSAQQARSNIEAQRANAHLTNVAPGSLKDKRNQVDAEYQAQNQAFLAKQAQARAAAGNPIVAQPAAGSVPPAPANPKEKAAWARQYGGKYDPATGAPLQESVTYDELQRLVSLVQYR